MCYNKKEREVLLMAEKTKKYTDEFKKQIVALYVEGGRKASELSIEYGMAKSTVKKWVDDYTNTGSFKAKDNRSQEEEELIRLRKENKQLQMENDILKQAALIMARK